MPLENKGQGQVETTSVPRASNGAFNNPPFAHQILNLSSPLGEAMTGRVNLRRGKIWREFSDDGYAYGVNFLYNPSTISVSHSAQDTGFQPLPQTARDPNDPTSYILPLGSQVTFSLLFDRTYELWKGVQSGTSNGQRGVEEDISALYYIMGLKNYIPGDNRLIKSPPVNNTVFVLFGGPDSLKFYGFISNLSVTYTHWSVFMVPMRATAAVTLTMFSYSPGGTAKAPVASGSTP